MKKTENQLITRAVEKCIFVLAGDNGAMTGQGFDPGRVTLHLICAAGRVAEVRVACERPAVAAALRGRPADKAAALVPLLYSLCGKAQGVAAHLALAAARGRATPPRADDDVSREIAGEHLWRLLLDWPKLLGLPADEALFVAARRRLATTDYRDWAAAELKPIFDRLLAALAALPEPAGGTPIRDRVAARIAAALSPAPGRVAAEAVAPGVGRATVDTARGPLIHTLRLDGELMADYAIDAPTDRLFAADSPLVGWLSGLSEAAARELAPRAVLALDPCVPFDVAQGGPYEVVFQAG
jgi:hypothetical protein